MEAITRDRVRQYFSDLEEQADKLSELLKSKDLVKQVEKLLEENNALKAEIEALKKEKAKVEIQKLEERFSR